VWRNVARRWWIGLRMFLMVVEAAVVEADVPELLTTG
jgi:hypothetical protein